MLTATERAEAMALQVLISARLHNSRVVTHDLVDAVMSRDADTEQGKANKARVRRIVRARAASEFVRVIFTEGERYWAIREQLHHMDGDEVHALRDSISNGGDNDPRGDDRALIDAISVRMSSRLAPARLYGCKPVSIRLWREPRRPAVEEQPAPVEARFAAFAAHEAADRASLRIRPEDLTHLARHLLAVGKTAPTGLHASLVDAHAAVEDVAAAVETADALGGLAGVQATNAANDRARAAVDQARAAIVAVEPTAKQMRGTDMPVTPDAIRAAARGYHAVGEYPEELAAIETGTPTVQVWCRSSGGLGREIIAIITAGIRADIGHIPAHRPIVLRFRRLDGCLNAAENARRLLWRVTPSKRYLRVEDVPVEFLQDSQV